MLRTGASAETSRSWGLTGWLRALFANYGAEVAEGELFAEFGQDITHLIFRRNKVDDDPFFFDPVSECRIADGDMLAAI